MNPDYEPAHSEEQPMKDNADAPTTVSGAADGFVIFDSRTLMYYAGATDGRSHWTQRASGAFVFPTREDAQKVNARQKLCSPTAFIHPVTRTDIGQ